MSSAPKRPPSTPLGSWLGDRLFLSLLAIQGGIYVLLILALLVADAAYTTGDDFVRILNQPDIQFAVGLTLVSCTLAAVLSLWVAIPLGYLLARFRFPGRWLLDSILDIPIVLPPLVIGLSLLILFHLPIRGTTLEQSLQDRFGLRVTYTAVAVVLAQFTVACAFAVRTMRVSFDQIDPRTEQVAWTLGCGRLQGFLRVALPQARRGMLAAFTLAWARSLGEFGPILVFAGATRQRTEVLSTTVFLELSVGNLESAVAVSLVMVGVALVVLVLVRLLGAEVVA